MRNGTTHSPCTMLFFYDVTYWKSFLLCLFNSQESPVHETVLSLHNVCPESNESKWSRLPFVMVSLDDEIKFDVAYATSKKNDAVRSL